MQQFNIKKKLRRITITAFSCVLTNQIFLLKKKKKKRRSCNWTIQFDIPYTVWSLIVLQTRLGHDQTSARLQPWINSLLGSASTGRKNL